MKMRDIIRRKLLSMKNWKKKKRIEIRVGSWENESWESCFWQRELLRLKIRA